MSPTKRKALQSHAVQAIHNSSSETDESYYSSYYSDASSQYESSQYSCNKETFLNKRTVINHKSPKHVADNEKSDQGSDKIYY